METNWASRITDLEALGWTLTAVSERIGLSLQGVSDIKQGRTKAPNGDAAVALHALWRRESRAAARRAVSVESHSVHDAQPRLTP